MQIALKELEYCKYAVHCECDKTLIEDKRLEVLSQFKRAPVPGNRPGKASLNAIKMYYKREIDDGVKRALADEAYRNTLFEKNLKPFGQPEFSSTLLTNGKFECDFSISTRPVIELQQYKEMDLPKPKLETTVEITAEQQMQQLRIRLAESVLFTETDFVQSGDHIIVDYEAFDGDEKLSNLCVKDELLVVGKSEVPGLDDAILGMRLGETREIVLQMPGSALPSLANKTLKFVTTFKVGSKVMPMPLNDELAKKAGFNSFDELRAAIHGQASQDIAKLEKNALTHQLLARLYESHKFQVPQWLIIMEAQYLAASSQMKWDNLSDIDRESYINMAERQVKTSFILEAVREVEPEAALSEADCIETIQQQLTSMGQNASEITQNINKRGYLEALVARIKNEYTIDFLMKSCKIVE
jgi:trigger factor